MSKPCAHHWIIEAPTHRTSKGYCKLCGEEREGFDNGPQFENHSKWSQAETLELRENYQPARFRMHEGAIAL